MSVSRHSVTVQADAYNRAGSQIGAAPERASIAHCAATGRDFCGVTEQYGKLWIGCRQAHSEQVVLLSGWAAEVGGSRSDGVVLKLPVRHSGRSRHRGD